MMLDINENAPRDVPTFEQWAQNTAGIQRLANVEITPNADCRLENPNDYTVIAQQSIPANQPIIFVPNNVVWNTDRIKQEEFGNALDPALDFLTKNGVAQTDVPKFVLLVKLLQETTAGQQSPYFEWFNSLPRIYYNAASMTPSCIECLPPLIYRYAREKQVLLENFSKALQKVDFLDKSMQSYALGLWAFNVVSTRSFAVNNDERVRYMAPLADYVNHGTYPNAAFHVDEQGNFLLYAIQQIEPGTPITVSYGAPTNPSQLFAIYGFLDDSSPATFCKITHIQPNDELRNLGYEDVSRLVFYKDTGEIAQEVWDVVLYDVLGKVNKADQQSFYQAHMEGNADLKQAMHQHYFAQTSVELKKHVDGFLNNLQELSKKAEGKNFAEHPRLPLILHHNAFVAQAFLNVKANLDPMVEQAQQQSAMA